MPNKPPLVTFFLYLRLPHRLESFSPSSHRRLRSIRHYSISIWSSLAWINSIIAISIRLSTWIRSDCPYHAGISLILILLSCSTSIESWDESTLTPTTTNCLTWAPAYVKDARLTQMYSFLPASWVGDTHEETDFLPIGDQEERRGTTSKPSYWQSRDNVSTCGKVLAGEGLSLRWGETGIGLLAINEN